jgi:hypothetical protein
MKIELPQLTLQQKWETAESNLVYFIVCGISYAKSRGQTAEDFGTWAGQVAEPFWDEAKSKGPRGLVEGISSNKQQFQDFEMEILDESDISIRGRMKCFGENLIRKYFQYKISVDEYVQFFDKKWVAIADYMGLEYKQHVEGDWLVFTVTNSRDI